MANEQVTILMDEPRSAPNLGPMLLRLRNRAMLLRLQALACMALIALISIALIIFLASRSYSYSMSSEKLLDGVREPPNFSRLEAMHADLVAKIEAFTESADSDSQLKFQDSKAQLQNIAARVQQSVEDLREVKKDLTVQVAKEREMMIAEIRKLRDERDAALRDAAERSTIIKLTGETAFRVGAILVSIYFISILANIAKYWFRVADHLNAVADSIDTLAAAGMNLDKGISALTPHPIDFQVEEPMSLKTVKELLGMTPKRQKDG